MSLYDKIGIAAGFGAIFAANVAFPALIPFTLAGMAIGSGTVLVGSYITKRYKHKTAKSKPASEEITETQTLEGIVEDTPLIVKCAKGKKWDAHNCELESGQDIYKFIRSYLAQNPKLLVERERPLREVKTLDPDAEFYHYKYKIQVVGDKDKLSPVEDWKVYGSPYVCVEKAPPKGRKLEPIVEGILKKECIEVKNPPENISGRVEDTANIMSFVRLGLTLDLQAPPKRERKSRKKK